jgi:hypothetical protein
MKAKILVAILVAWTMAASAKSSGDTAQGSSFGCDEIDNIDSIKDVFTKTESGYDFVRLDSSGQALDQFSLLKSEVEITPLNGLGSFHFRARDAKRGITVDVDVAGQGSKMKNSSPKTNVNKKHLACWV